MVVAFDCAMLVREVMGSSNRAPQREHFRMVRPTFRQGRTSASVLGCEPSIRLSANSCAAVEHASDRSIACIVTASLRATTKACPIEPNPFSQREPHVRNLLAAVLRVRGTLVGLDLVNAEGVAPK